MDIEEIIKRCQKVEGWFTPLQMRGLLRFVKDIKGLLVEIGTYRGKSTLYWRLANPDLEIVTIDIVDDPNPPFWVEGYQVGTVIDQDIVDLGNITVIQDDNRNVVKTWERPIDILFIDGDEKYDSVYGDMQAWWPFIKSKGYMFVHNYCTGNADTRRAVNNWESEHKQIGDMQENFITAEIYIVQKT